MLFATFYPFKFEESLLLLDETMPHRLVNNQKRFFIRGICIERSITFHKNDLICAMSAFLFEQMSSEDMVNS